ncbi:MAG TPA: hypothetical protein PLN86_04590 [Candidatus Hydrogenedentes bacterium]|nr:hypothetical protein [Candidatus Hydrogenedentota bacterium]
MTTKKLIIKQLARSPQFNDDDVLMLQPGVNVIVGKPNSGKTKWLEMLDYLMGDDSKPEKAFSIALKEKYDSVKALIGINGDEIWIERRWKQQGAQGKVFINDKPISQSEFSSFFLERIGMPILHFPKGNPYEERSWPELSWRTLFRHIYRQQRFWGDLTDKQLDSERQAAILQFVGIAEYVYSDATGALVDIKKEIWKLQGAREQYLSMLDEIAREITDEKEFRIALTADSINASIARIQIEIQEFEIKREATLQSLKNEVAKQNPEQDNKKSDFENLSKKWADLQIEKEENNTAIATIGKRIGELKEYQLSIVGELARMERAKDAGDVLSVLKITHCPACDQPVKANENPDHCYLCGQDIEKSSDSEETDKRIENEVKRLEEDLKEAKELSDTLVKEQKARNATEQNIVEEISRIENRLRPIRQTAAIILPPDISIWDMEIGRLQERIRQLERIRRILEEHKNISAKIEKLKEKEESLKAKIQSETRKVNYEAASEWISDGMNTYLNALVALDKKLWTQEKITVKLKEKDFSVLVGNQDWYSQLGGTLILYFLLSYQYALLNLTKFEQCNYPGIAIIDLPAQLGDDSTIRDKENFVVEPFIKLLKQREMRGSQLIMTGAAFESLEGVNKISLTNVWK